MKRIICILLVSAVLCCSPSVNLGVHAEPYSDYLTAQGFPQSYISALSALHKKYPSWTIKAFPTGLDWNTAVKGERTPHSQQLISKNSAENMLCSCSDCKKNGSYVIREGSSWVSASKTAVEYYMDPRNFLNEKYIFQFEDTGYNDSHTKKGVEAIIKNTFMSDSLITYKNAAGENKTYNSSMKYSDAIMKAAKDKSMNAYYLASKLVQEIGGSKPTAGGASGTVSPFLGIYNFYNIGAYSGASDGLAWANGYLKTNKKTVLYSEKDITKKTTDLSSDTYLAYRGEKTNNSKIYYLVSVYYETAGGYTAGKVGYVLESDIRTGYRTYERPWTNPYKSIYYGAGYIAEKFRHQNTGYLQKFNVNMASGDLYGHEYMANVVAAASEAYSSYKAYSQTGILDSPKTLSIPVFSNMPDDPSSSLLLPSQPEKLTLTARTANSLSFKWTGSNSADGYQISYINNTKGRSYTKTSKTPSVKLNSLTGGNSYAVKVRGYTIIGGQTVYGAYSSALAVKTIPAAVSGLRVSARSAASVTLRWDKAAGADGYYVYRYRKAKNTYTQKAKVTAEKVKLTGIPAASDYNYCVSAYFTDAKTVLTGAKSEPLKASTKSVPPTEIKASSPLAKKIKLKWSPTKSAGYAVQWSTYKNFSANKKTVYFKGGKTKTGTVTAHYSKKQYFARVRSYRTINNKKLYSAWSAAVKIITK